MTKKATGTREWSTHSVNIQTGCEHDCAYCYAKARAARFGQCEPERWKDPEINLRKAEAHIGTKTGTVMFPTTHDITPRNFRACREVLQRLLLADNRVLIVTKPHLDCVRDLCHNLVMWRRQNQVLWRFTIGTINDRILKLWEPGAPRFTERLRSLALAYSFGYKTSVSCEPLLADGALQAVQLVSRLRPFVSDSIWIGRANQIKARVSLNCPGDEDMASWAADLEAIWTREEILRLQEHLRDDPLIRWKDSIKTMVGIPLGAIGEDR